MLFSRQLILSRCANWPCYKCCVFFIFFLFLVYSMCRESTCKKKEWNHGIFTCLISFICVVKRKWYDNILLVLYMYALYLCVYTCFCDYFYIHNLCFIYGVCFIILLLWHICVYVWEIGIEFRNSRINKENKTYKHVLGLGFLKYEESGPINSPNV